MGKAGVKEEGEVDLLPVHEVAGPAAVLLRAKRLPEHRQIEAEHAGERVHAIDHRRVEPGIVAGHVGVHRARQADSYAFHGPLPS
jgi:hypothetical protein